MPPLPLSQLSWERWKRNRRGYLPAETRHACSPFSISLGSEHS